MIRTKLVLAILFLFFAGAPTYVFAGVITFYGFDQASGPGGPTPNTDAAHASFIAALAPSTVGVENFESSTVGSFNGGTLSVSFPATSITGTITANDTDYALVANSNDAGFNIFTNYGTNFLKVATNGGTTFFDLRLSQAVTALGFFTSDVSDFGLPGFFSERIALDGGATIDIVNVSPANIQSGSASYFGVISSTPFTDITFFNPNPTNNPFQGDDGFGIDNLVVGMGAQPVPEPATFVSAGTGFLIVLGFAWRRRRSA